jgi:YYY domain-containing protein
LLLWLLAVEILGLIFVPIAFSLFKRLPDRGVTLSKVLGLLAASYVYWIVVLTGLVPNSQGALIGIWAALAVGSGWLWWKRGGEIWAFARERRGYLVVAEVVFLGIFVTWASIAAQAPGINHTEKPMDFGFLNAILKSESFPPEDMWLSGHSISYYYFGHLMMAGLTKLTGIPSSVSYNLSVALGPALLSAAIYGLAYNLIRLAGASAGRAMAFALLAPVLVGLISNLVGVLEFVHAQGWGSEGFWGWVNIKDLGPSTHPPSFFPQDYNWWWRSTRVIDTVVDGRSLDYTINEFPYFSFLLGDLHAHVLALPFLVLNVALALNLFLSKTPIGFSWLKAHLWESLALALSLGALGFINIFDLPVFAALLAGVIYIKALSERRWHVGRALTGMLGVAAPVFVAAGLLYLPFYVTFNSQASGILPLEEVSTRPFYFVLIWGVFLTIGVAFLMRQMWSLGRPGKDSEGIAAAIVVFTFLPVVLWSVLVFFLRLGDDGLGGAVAAVGSRFGKLLPLLAIVGLASYSSIGQARLGRTAAAFCLAIMALAFYLLMGAELFYIKDFLILRMNTVFKLYYQAWLMLSVVGALGAYYWLSRGVPTRESFVSRSGERADPALPLRPPSLTLPPSASSPTSRGRAGQALKGGEDQTGASVGRTVSALRENRHKEENSKRLLASVGYWAVPVAAGLLLVGSFYYPAGAALDRMKSNNDPATLDGLEYMKRWSPGEYEAIVELRDRAPRGRIIEAVGDDYSEYGRVAASTGLPSPINWPGHELQWRGSSQPFAGRQEDVAAVYQSRNTEEISQILDRYDIRYVFFGPRERTKYGSESLLTLPNIMKVYFQSGDVIVYERLVPTRRDDI